MLSHLDEKARGIYLAYGGAEPTVFDSQVLDFLTRIRREGFPMRLIAFQHWSDCLLRRSFLEDKKRNAREAAGTEPLFFPRVPRNLFNLNGSRLLSTIRGQKGARFVHARGIQSTALAVELKRFIPGIKILMDHRGVEAEEHLSIVRREKNREPNSADLRWAERLRELERESAIATDHIFCVSHALRRRLIEQIGIRGEKIEVIPTCVETSRFQNKQEDARNVRQKLNLQNRFVLIYAGSLRAWQPVETLPRILHAARHSAPDAFLLALTPHLREARQAMEAGGFSARDFKALMVRHEEIPAYLTAADAAVMLRDNDEVNRVAAPTKFAEYLAAGLPILSTPCPEDAARLIQQEGLGALVPYPYTPKQLSQSIAELRRMAQNHALRQKAREAAQKIYSWDSALPAIKRRYVELLGYGEVR